MLLLLLFFIFFFLLFCVFKRQFFMGQLWFRKISSWILNWITVCRSYSQSLRIEKNSDCDFVKCPEKKKKPHSAKFMFFLIYFQNNISVFKSGFLASALYEQLKKHYYYYFFLFEKVIQSLIEPYFCRACFMIVALFFSDRLFIIHSQNLEYWYLFHFSTDSSLCRWYPLFFPLYPHRG